MQRRLPRETVKTSTEIPLSVPPRNPTWPWPWEQGAPFSVAASGPGRTEPRAEPHAELTVRCVSETRRAHLFPQSRTPTVGRQSRV